jgi:Fur family ferric uptake transcriptional regulator
MKHQHNHDFDTILHSKNLKSTPVRLAILKLLAESEQPLSADELTKKLKNLNFDRATLFRSLKTFTESHVVNTVDLGEGHLRYEMNCDLHHHHHHIICTSCKEISIVPFCIPEQFKVYLQRRGYKNIAHRLDFSGLCHNCA